MPCHLARCLLVDIGIYGPENTTHDLGKRVNNSIYMGVSENSGTPKSSILIGFSIINHPLWGTPTIYWQVHIPMKGCRSMIYWFIHKVITPINGLINQWVSLFFFLNLLIGAQELHVYLVFGLYTNISNQNPPVLTIISSSFAGLPQGISTNARGTSSSRTSLGKAKPGNFPPPKEWREIRQQTRDAEPS